MRISTDDVTILGSDAVGHQRTKLIVVAMSGVSALLGMTVLVGWYTHTVTLIQVLPVLVPMQYNTALGFLLCGTGMLGIAYGKARVATICGGTAGIIGLLTLFEYIFGINIGIDQLLMVHDILVNVSHPGRMAPNTAASFLLSGVSLIIVALFRHRFRVLGALGAFVLLLGTMSFIGYLSGTSTAYGWGRMTRMAVHTSIGFIALGAGIVTLAWREGQATEAQPVHDLARQRWRVVAASTAIMATAVFLFGQHVFRELYAIALDGQKNALSALVLSRGELISAVAEFDAIHIQHDYPGGAAAATVSQIVAAHKNAPRFGDTGELVLARRAGDQIVFFVSEQPDIDSTSMQVISFDSELAEPMRRALGGGSGTVTALDYRGEVVLAAFRPVGRYGWGLVGKISLAEIRAPFVRVSILAGGFAFVLIALGALAFLVTVDPTIQLAQRAAEMRGEITERKLAEQVIRKNEESLARAQSIAHLGSWEWDIVTNEMQCSNELYRIFGVSSTDFDLDFAAFTAAIHPDDWDQVKQVTESSLIRNDFSVEHRVMRPDGQVCTVHERGEVTYDDGGRPITMVGTALDITERKRVEEDLRRSNQELEQFAYVASHDLQEPLRMVSSYTQLLKQRYFDQLDDDAREFIGFASDGATRMQRLIQDLLKLSRVTTHGSDLAPVDAQSALDEALANIQMSINETHTVVTSDNLPVVRADHSQLVMLFQNLIGNAIKFQGESSPRIHVGGERVNNLWRFTVQDDGIGIDPQYAERIFLVFQRLHVRSEYPGTGIGLPVCKRIVERHGGEISVDSTLGEGSSFHFTLSTADKGKIT
jgi:PAS domain S-box-containing protein